MANIIYWLEQNQYGVVVNGSDATKFDVHGQVLGDEGSGQPHAFECLSIDMGALASTVNTAIRDAAIAQFEADESPLTVGALDKKTFVGGALGL